MLAGMPSRSTASVCKKSAPEHMAAFSSNVMMRNSNGNGPRVQVPILDPEAHVTYYCVCRAEDRRLLAPVFHEIAERGL